MPVGASLNRGLPTPSLSRSVLPFRSVVLLPGVSERARGEGGKGNRNTDMEGSHQRAGRAGRRRSQTVRAWFAVGLWNNLRHQLSLSEIAWDAFLHSV